MSKPKVDFIADLLSSKRIKDIHKERFLTLAVQEIKKIEEVDEDMWVEINKLKTQLEALTPDSNSARIFKKEHTPQNTVGFLRKFDSELKYFTHKWDLDGEFDRNKEIEKAKQIIQKTHLPLNLYHRIKVFVTKNETKKSEIDPEWFVHNLFGKYFKCDYSWDNVKFVNWFDNSISKDITSPEISDKMIEPFKHSIQIRDGRLKDHIKPLVDKVLGKEFAIEFLRLDQAKFYTNTQELMRGVAAIFESISKYAKVNDRYNVRIEYMDSDRSLRITHIKSQSRLGSTNPDFLGGNFKGIAEGMFNSLCNWSIEACFPDGNKRINILTDRPELEKIENLDYTPEGFTYILFFY
jgi:hypothetical protein